MIFIRITPDKVADIRKMSVHEVADKTVEVLETGKYPFVVLNFANPDMVSSLLTNMTEIQGRTYRSL